MPISERSSYAFACRLRPGAGRPTIRIDVRAALLVALGALPASACSQNVNRAPNVVLICWDTVRADHLGAYGYRERPTTPALDELGSRSVVFSVASAPASWTKPSVPSFFTGTYPCQHGVYEGSARLEVGVVSDVLPEEATTIAEVLHDNGYETAAFVHNAQLRPGNGFEQGFDSYRDRSGDAREIRWRALDWLDARDTSRPFLLYLHYLDAHWPYSVPDEYATRFASAEEIARFRGSESRDLRDAINDGEVPFDDGDRRALEALYDGALRYLDDQLALLLAGLELRGLADDTIVCVVADHGEEFGEHGKIGHGHGLWEPLLRVPWILHVPGRHGERIDTPVSLVDLFPTLLSAAGIASPVDVAGVDRLANRGEHRPLFAEHKTPDRYLQSLRDGRAKLVRELEAPPRHADEVPVTIGERWEAELERTGSDALRAIQLKPRDEAPDDPVEIKGWVAGLRADRFSLGGIEVRFSASTRRTLTDGARSEELFEGRAVKVRGRFDGDAFVAERIKIYAPDDEGTFEIRGPVQALEQAAGTGRLLLGGRWIEFDRETRFKDVPQRAPMARADIVFALENGWEDASSAGFRVEARSFDLESDPDESSAGQAAEPALFRLLDETSRDLVRRRIFDGTDREIVSEDAIQRLRDLGYLR